MEKTSQVRARYSDNTVPRNTASIISTNKSSPYRYYPEVALAISEILGENVNPNVSYYISEINDPDTHDRENVIFLKNSNNPQETMVLGKLQKITHYTRSEVEDELMEHVSDITGNQLTDLEKQTILKAYQSNTDHEYSIIGIEAKDSSGEKCFLMSSEDGCSVDVYVIDSSELHVESINPEIEHEISDISSEIYPDISKKVVSAITDCTMSSEIMESTILESRSQIYEVEMAVITANNENESLVETKKDLNSSEKPGIKKSSWSFLGGLFNLFGFIKVIADYLAPMFLLGLFFQSRTK